MRGNVTIDPLAHATSVASPEICEIRSLKSGQILDAKRYIESVRYDRLVRIRSLIKEAMEADRARVACAICGTPVYLVASPDRAFFFRHRVEDGSCPALTRSALSDNDIRAMKYRGAQESDAHRRLKGLIERSLRADSRFTELQVEVSWHGLNNPAALRRPDVQARCGDLRLAFEAQLSTTFLDVVIGRKSLYRAESALLIWVLPYFDPAYRHMTVDDLLFNNNSNVLIIDQESVSASENAGRLTVRCTYRRPSLEGQFPGSLVAFGVALKATGHGGLLRDQDKRGHWARKAERLRAKYLARDPTYATDAGLKAVLSFLFPELATRFSALNS